MTKYLGYQMEDIVTGLTGIAYSYTETITGNQQYALQPRGDGKTVPDLIGFDVQTLKPVSEAPVVPVTPAQADVVVSLGDFVEDTIAGISGIADRKVTFINGCVYFDIVGKKREGDEAVPQRFVAHGQLHILAPKAFQKQKETFDEVNRKIAGLPDTPVTPAPRTGGPMTRNAVRL